MRSDEGNPGCLNNRSDIPQPPEKSAPIHRSDNVPTAHCPKLGPGREETVASLDAP